MANTMNANINIENAARERTDLELIRAVCSAIPAAQRAVALKVIGALVDQANA